MRLLLASPIDPAAIERLGRQHDVVLGHRSPSEIGELITDSDILVFRSGVQISRDLIERAPRLRLIVRAGSGLDNIDLPAAETAGIRVARVPGASPEAVAEMTLGLMLSAARNLCHADALIRRGEWPKHELGGYLIAGKTMGIVGAGRIGKRTGEMCAALGMRVLGCVEFPGPDREADMAQAGIKLCDFDTLIAESDFVSVHTPLKDSTRSMIDAAVIARMKPGAILINTSRGGVVDESAVRDALVTGHLSAAAFDVHVEEGDGVVPDMANLPNVVLTPHIGGMAHETQHLIGRRIVEIVEAFMQGRLDEILTTDERVV